MRPDDNDRSAHVVWEAIERDPRVAWRATGKDRYLYRPGQLLVDTRYEGRLRPFLREEKAAPDRCHSTEDRLLLKLGLRRWFLPAGADDAPDVVDRLRSKLREREGKVTPEQAIEAVNVTSVLAGAQVFKFGPGDLPSDGGPEPVEPQPSKELGDGRGVRVVILDTGFVKESTQAPILAHDYADDGDDGDSFYDETHHEIDSVFGGHGTFIAGIIRQRAPYTTLDPEVTLDDIGLADDLEVANDLLRISKDTDIVNLSLGGPNKDDAPPPALARVLRKLGEETHVVVVAAAGNDFVESEKAGHPEIPMWPAAFGGMKGYEHVVGVAAVNRQVKATDFSNRGPWVRACAYGDRERSTYVEGNLLPPAGPRPFRHPTAYWSGTSFAAPRVAGVIAATMTASPPMSARDAVAHILATAPDGPPGFGKFVE